MSNTGWRPSGPAREGASDCLIEPGATIDAHNRSGEGLSVAMIRTQADIEVFIATLFADFTRALQLAITLGGAGKQDIAGRLRVDPARASRLA